MLDRCAQTDNLEARPLYKARRKAATKANGSGQSALNGWWELEQIEGLLFKIDPDGEWRRESRNFDTGRWQVEEPAESAELAPPQSVFQILEVTRGYTLLSTILVERDGFASFPVAAEALFLMEGHDTVGVCTSAGLGDTVELEPDDFYPESPAAGPHDGCGEFADDRDYQDYPDYGEASALEHGAGGGDPDDGWL